MDKEQIKATAAQKLAEKGELAASVYLAETLFEGITDKTGRPYFDHLQRVSAGIADYHTKPIGFLHDILEDIDGWSGMDLLEIGFSNHTVLGVVAMTNDGEPYFDFIVRCGMFPQSIIGKKSDLQDNSDTLRLRRLPNEKDIERLKKYHLAYHYLDDIEKGAIPKRTPFGTWLAAQPVDMQDWHLFAKHSSEGKPSSRTPMPPAAGADAPHRNFDM